MSTVSPAVSDSQGTSPTFARGRPGPTSNVVAEAAAGETRVAASSALGARSFLVMGASFRSSAKDKKRKETKVSWTYNPIAWGTVKEKVSKRNRRHNARLAQGHPAGGAMTGRREFIKAGAALSLLSGL